MSIQLDCGAHGAAWLAAPAVASAAPSRRRRRSASSDSSSSSSSSSSDSSSSSSSSSSEPDSAVAAGPSTVWRFASSSGTPAARVCAPLRLFPATRHSLQCTPPAPRPRPPPSGLARELAPLLFADEAELGTLGTASGTVDELPRLLAVAPAHRRRGPDPTRPSDKNARIKVASSSLLLLSTAGADGREIYVNTLESPSQKHGAARFVPSSGPALTAAAPILSLSIAPPLPEPSYEMTHSGPWLSVLTRLGVRVYSIARATRAERREGYPKFYLRPIHIFETQSALTQQKGLYPVERLEEPIVHWCWHPTRRDRALAVDATGRVWRWEASLFQRSRIQHGALYLSFDRLPFISSSPKSEWWRVAWQEDGAGAILITRSSIQLIDWETMDSRLLFQPSTIPRSLRTEEITSVRTVPNSHWLWVATTSSVRLFDLSHLGTPRISWLHHRGEDLSLSLSLVPAGSAEERVLRVVLASQRGRLLQLYEARGCADGSALISGCSSALALPSALPASSAVSASVPRFVDFTAYPRSEEWSAFVDEASRIGMLEMESSGAVWLSALAFEGPAAAEEQAALRDLPLEVTDPVLLRRIEQEAAPDHVAPPSSGYDLSEAYKVFMSSALDRVTYGDALQHAFEQFDIASTLLQRLDSPYDSFLTAHDLLALARRTSEHETRLAASLNTSLPSATLLHLASSALTSRLEGVMRSLSLDAYASPQMSLHVASSFCTELFDVLTDNVEPRRPRRLGADYGALTMPWIQAADLLAERWKPLVGSRAHDANLVAAREVTLDIWLAGQVGAMRPVLVQKPPPPLPVPEPAPQEADEDREASPPTDGPVIIDKDTEEPQGIKLPTPPPPVMFSFLTPRASASRRSGGGRTTTAAARLLLAEWDVGTAPSAYVPVNPYLLIDDGASSSGWDSASSAGTASTRGRSTQSQSQSRGTRTPTYTRTPSIGPYTPSRSDFAGAPPSIATAGTPSQRVPWSQPHLQMHQSQLSQLHQAHSASRETSQMDSSIRASSGSTQPQPPQPQTQTQGTGNAAQSQLVAGAHAQRRPKKKPRRVGGF